VDPRWVLPVDDGLPDLAERYRRVVVIEDNLRSGGIGEAIGLALVQAGGTVPVQGFGVPSKFIDHGRRVDILNELGLSAQEIARDVVEAMVGGGQGRTTLATAFGEIRSPKGTP
jgi:1-deoxy-D-xylulose-5-phosphate synthase